MFAENVPFYGYLAINGDDVNIKKISKKISRAQVKFGESKGCHYQITKISSNKGKQSFEIFDAKNNKNHKFKLNLPGKHNVFNAAAAIAVSMEEGISLGAIKSGIQEFSGVGRRYEKHDLIINQKEVTLIDDYGHHPLEIESNINAYKEEYTNKKVCMIFQPHRFSRTAQLFDDFVRVLSKTDLLILLDIYSASEKPIRGIHSRIISETIKQKGHKNVTYLKSHDDVNDLIMDKIEDFDILVTQGAGSVSKVCESIKNKWTKLKK
jgi:UDP-N-acetylmuramate--alanine ligase